MSSNKLNSEKNRRILLALARESIRFGLEQNRLLPSDIDRYPEQLTALGASFVTLEINGRLRGCIGTLEAYRPLAQDITENAYQAAFSDPRFTPLQKPEFDQLDIHIAVLTPPQEMLFDSEQKLLAQMQPNVDGIIIQEGTQKATFLPSVWESLPDPPDFLQHLKQKAGFAPDYWSDRIRVFRYSTVILE